MKIKPFKKKSNVNFNFFLNNKNLEKNVPTFFLYCKNNIENLIIITKNIFAIPAYAIK